MLRTTLTLFQPPPTLNHHSHIRLARYSELHFKQGIGVPPVILTPRDAGWSHFTFPTSPDIPCNNTDLYSTLSSSEQAAQSTPPAAAQSN